ncbi:MAG: DnaJ C-terminal domain-containing protein, partial [Lachnospirales bacterium]
GGSGAKKGTSAENCSYCNGSGYEKVTKQTPFGMISQTRVCSHCHGEGKIIREKCPKCGGAGNTKVTKKVSVDIPKGIQAGQSIRKKGLGGAGSKGGSNGDLFIQINVTPSKTFAREGNDLFVDVPISITQAVFGGTIKIPTIDGDYEYSLKSGTQPNTTATIRGKGAYNVRNENYRGNLNVTFKVQIPTELNKAQKDALTKFAEASGETAPKRKGFFK